MGRPALPAALRQSVAAADAAPASADLDTRFALAGYARTDRPSRLFLFPVVAQPRQGNCEIGRPIRQSARAARLVLSARSHGYPAVDLCRADRPAGAGRIARRNLVLSQELPEGSPAPR